VDARPSIMERRAAPDTDGASALVFTANESERILVQAALDGIVCNLRFTSSRRDALAIVTAESVALVIADGDTKTLSWRELLEQILRPGAAPAPKLIVVSRWTDDRMWAEVLNLGAYDLLPRPLAAEELAWVVRSALSERNGAHSPV